MTLRIKGATTIKGLTSVNWSPNLLFAAGEQGVWYDPSDFSTMFQDTAGLQGVTATTQSVALLLDKRNPNVSTYFDGTGDRISASSASLAFGTGDFTIEAWVNSSDVSVANQRGFFQTSSASGGLSTSYTTGVVIYFGAGANGAVAVNVGGGLFSTAAGVVAANTWYHIAVTRASGTVRIFVNGALSASGSGNTSNLTGQNICIGGYYDANFLLSGYISNLRITSGTAIYTAAFTPPTSALQPLVGTCILTCGNAGFSNPAFTITGDTVFSTLNPFVASPTGNHATQSTAANRPTLQIDGNGKYYLSFDGSNDSLATGSVNFTSTDKMSIFAGARKLTNTVGVIAELSSNADTNQNVFSFANDAVLDQWWGKIVGTVVGAGSQVYGSATSPATGVLSFIGDFAGATVTDKVKLRINTVSASGNNGIAVSSTAFGNYPIYVGARGSSSIFFNGRIYGLIIRGAASTASQIAMTETYMNSKTAAY